MNELDVLVVGAGPTGLCLALGLARSGRTVRIIDKSQAPFVGSRGKGLSARSLEIIEDLGVIEEILAAGLLRLPHRRYSSGTIAFDGDPHADAVVTPSTPYPSGLIIPQWRTEQILRDRLLQCGVEVEQSVEVVSFEQTVDSVTATLAAGDPITARYLVGCDGGRSIVRKTLGIDFAGESSPQGMILGDVEVVGLTSDRWYQWVEPTRGFLALCPFANSTSWQFQAVPFTDFDDNGNLPEPTLEYFQRIVDDIIDTDVQLANPTWLSTYRVNVRMAESFRVRRVFLAGDAAHVHPPAGGLGMNTGIQDAYNLSWKLALALRGGDESILDTYQEERQPIAAWTLGVSGAGLQRFASSLAAADSQGMGAIQVPDGHQLSLNYHWSSLSSDLDGSTTTVRAGDRAPDAPMTDAAGNAVRLFDLFRGPHFTVLGFGSATTPTLAALACRFPQLIHCYTIDIDLIDNAGHARDAYGSSGDAIVVVRSDGYIALTAPLVADTVLVDALEIYVLCTGV